MEDFAEHLCEEALEMFMEGPTLDIETAFARAFAESADVRLFFTDGDEAYTDGRNIVVDPAYRGIYKDARCIEQSLRTLGWPENTPITPWIALKMVTRGLVIHECLHLLYSPLPGKVYADPDYTGSANARKTISAIANIVEDAYVEAVGASVYENAGLYLKFVRVADYHAGAEDADVAGPKDSRPSTSGQVATRDVEPREMGSFADGHLLVEYINHMARVLLYSMFGHPNPSPAIEKYVEATKPLFLEASMLASPDDRYSLCKKICTLITPLIPEDTETKLPASMLASFLPGHKSHAGGNLLGALAKPGRPLAVRRRLFGPEDGGLKGEIDVLAKTIKTFGVEEEDAEVSRGWQGGHTMEFGGNRVGASPLHKGIRINESHPGIDRRLRKEYVVLRTRLRPAIDTGNARFLRLLRALVPSRGNRFLFGESMDSRRLGDPRGRFWVRSERGIGDPDLAVLLLIDGSGSMHGDSRECALDAAVVLHEVLRQQGIEHAVAEHRATFSAPEMEANVLLDFAPRGEEELNLLRLDAEGENRDGLALYWAERYISRKSSCGTKWIVVISDGAPSHRFDGYTGPTAYRDTACAARKIARRGTGVVAVALDDRGTTCENIRGIYPETVACRDPGHLAEQLLQILSMKVQ